ncbi:unnamed protein product [Pipistrellus nathusii]|uniref:Uncharacterized protein n=1 Tax=Pipistrellus nathusii TaxID=59473 RepID=A0ABP0AKF0_PIPNA
MLSFCSFFLKTPIPSYFMLPGDGGQFVIFLPNLSHTIKDSITYDSLNYLSSFLLSRIKCSYYFVIFSQRSYFPIYILFLFISAITPPQFPYNPKKQPPLRN